MLPEKDIALRQREGERIARLNAHSKETLRVGVLSTFNVGLIEPFLHERLSQNGEIPRFYMGPFGQVSQELLNPESALHHFQPNVVIVLTAAQDLLAPIFHLERMDDGGRRAYVENCISDLRSALLVLVREQPGAVCYLSCINTCEAPIPNVLDPSSALRGQRILQQLLTEFTALSSLSPRIVNVDWNWDTTPGGTDLYDDDRLWYLARMRLNLRGLAQFSQLFYRHYCAYRGTSRKVLVTDLDGTLWGGVVGEAGLQGIVLGGDGIGLAFQDVQRAMLAYLESGVLLAICSKNNPADVLDVFEKHSGMVLRKSHFAGTRINWKDKTQNLRDLADELNVDLDSFVFIDDNPAERDLVRTLMPEVLVPELPVDPVQRPRFLRKLTCFDRIAVTKEDRVRVDSYGQQAQRMELKSTSKSFEQFLASLQQVVSIEPVHSGTVARAAQLCQRTNQFNLTTKRYTLGDLENFSSNKILELYTLRARDRYGDNGVVGFAMLRFVGDVAEIDTLLMSCRALGRKLEDVFLSFLAQRARDRGARCLEGHYQATAKNSQAAKFYQERSFVPEDDNVFVLDLTKYTPLTIPEVSLEVMTIA